jgi:16S rRNA (guanine1207-N2)-methyltransferase
MRRQYESKRTKRTEVVPPEVIDVRGHQARIAVPPDIPGRMLHEEVNAYLFDVIASLHPGRLLEVGSPFGVAGIAARAAGDVESVTWIATNALSNNVIGKSLPLNKGGDECTVIVGESPLDAVGEFDAIVIHQVPSRELMEHWIRQAPARLAEGGSVLVAGAIDQGIKVSGHFLEELCGEVSIEAMGSGCRVVSGKAPRIETAEPLPETLHEEEIEGVPLRWVTKPGVFSADTLDPASLLLLQTIVLPKKGRILDLGCGAGVLGLWCAKKMPGIQVTMTDTDTASVACAQRGIELNELTNAQVVHGHRTEAVTARRNDVIVTNPPVHTRGRPDNKLVDMFVRDAAKAVGRKGRLWLVTAPTVPVMTTMRELYTEVSVNSESGSFRVYDAIRRPRRQGELRSGEDRY